MLRDFGRSAGLVLAGLLLVSLWIVGLSGPVQAKEIDVGDVPALIACADGGSSDPGDVCLVQSGSYQLSSDLLVIVPKLALRCTAGGGACVLDLGGQTASHRIKIGADRVSFGAGGAGFLVQNSGDMTEALLIDGSHEGITVEGNRFDGTVGVGIGTGIEIAGTQRFLRLIDNEIVGPKESCIFQGAASGGLIDAELRGNRCENAGTRGIELLGGEDFINVRFTGGSDCLVQGAAQEGIVFEFANDDQRVFQLYLSCEVKDNGSHGLLVRGGAGARNDLLGITLEDALFQGNGGVGALIEVDASLGGNGRIENVLCSRSDFLDNADGGLTVRTTGAGGEDIQNVQILACKAQATVPGAQGQGVEIEAHTSVQGVQIDGATVTGNTRFGVRIASDSGSGGEDVTDVEIAGSAISNNRRHGIVIEANRSGHEVAIHGNTIEGNGTPALGWGIRVEALNAAVRSVRIAGNTLRANGEGGIEVRANNEISSVSILENVLEDHPGTGIRLSTSTPAPSSGPAALLSGNTLIGSTQCSVPDPDDPTLAQGTGVLIDAEHVEVRKNGIKCHEVGIRVARPQDVSIRRNNITSNKTFAVDATLISPETVDATQNWWGDAAGPAVSPPSAVPNAVTVNVDASNPLSGTVTDAPDPFLIVEDVQLEPNGSGRLAITLAEVPEPGLLSLEVGPTGALVFDPAVIRVTRVDATLPYEVVSSEIDNDAGEVRFSIRNPTGADYLVGSGPVAILTVEAAQNAHAGDETDVTITTIDALETPGSGPRLITTIFAGRVRIVPQLQPSGVRGDLNGDGLLDVTDARFAAEAALGLRSLTPQQTAAADVAPPFGVIDITDARFLAEAALGLRSVPVGASNPKAAADPRLTLTPLSLTRVLAWQRGRAVVFRALGRGIKSLRVDVYDLAGRAVYRSDWSPGSSLRWTLRDAQGRPTANGVYLAVVAVRGGDGRVERSRVIKLLVLR